MKRIFHTWNEWECYPAGFYESRPVDGDMDDERCRDRYAAFLRDDDAFRAALDRVLAEWPNSTEHYLSNERMNRIAWLGQAAACIAEGLPSRFRGGYNRLTAEEQERADATALEYLNRWLVGRGEVALSPEEAASKTQMDLY